MKITEKMYLLAKEIVEEYESNEDIVEKFDNGSSIVLVKKGETCFENYSRNFWLDECTNISEDAINSLKIKKTKKEEDFSFEVRNCYLQCYSLFDDDLRPQNNKDTIAWHDTIEKLNRLDKLQFNDIVLITQAARNDKFWKKNFLSLVKLRRKDKDKIPYWKVFKEKFKFEKSKTQSMMEMHNQAKRDLGI